ncbi:hypothetical protein ABG067_007582 [Albugo candida]
MTDEDVRDWYVTLLKALAARLDAETVQFFLDQRRRDFALFAQALKFRQSSESMIQTAVKTILLQILQVNDPRVHQFLLLSSSFQYFEELVDNLMEMALKTQELLHERGTIKPKKKLSHRHRNHAVSVDQSLEGYCNVLYYLQDLLQVDVPELAYRLGSTIYDRHIKAFLVGSLLPACQPPPQRVCTALATFLLAQLLQIIEYAPLINATCFLLFSIEPLRDCSYATMTFGAGASSKQSNSTPPTRSEFLFHKHTSKECSKSLCYFDTRFEYGEWPIEEIVGLGISDQNCIRASILKLVTSSDPLLSYNAMLLVWHVCKNISVDRSLLKEVNIIEARKSTRCDSEISNSDQQVRQEVSSESIMSDCDVASADRQRSSVVSISKEVERSCLIDRILSTLNPIDSPVRNLKLAVHLLLHTVSSESIELTRPLDDEQAHTFSKVLCQSAKRVILCVNESIPTCDCVQVIENEISLSRAPSNISSRFLIRERNPVETNANECDVKSMRRALRVFLTLREAYRRLYPKRYDDLDRIVTFRHIKTQELHQCFQKGTPIEMENLVSLSCVWNKSVSGAFIISPEAIILAQGSRELGSTSVRFFLPIHTTKCSIDKQNDCILQMMESSSSNMHFSMQFENASDCSQALDHWRISSAEVNGFKVYHFIQYLNRLVNIDL